MRLPDQQEGHRHPSSVHQEWLILALELQGLAGGQDHKYDGFAGSQEAAIIA
jgi:hypothetical protein